MEDMKSPSSKTVVTFHAPAVPTTVSTTIPPPLTYAARRYVSDAPPERVRTDSRFGLPSRVCDELYDVPEPGNETASETPREALAKNQPARSKMQSLKAVDDKPAVVALRGQGVHSRVEDAAV